MGDDHKAADYAVEIKDCAMSVSGAGTVGTRWETLVVLYTFISLNHSRCQTEFHNVNRKFSYSSGHPLHSGDQSADWCCLQGMVCLLMPANLQKRSTVLP